MNNNVVTVTEIGTYKRCRRMWDYRYRQGLTPIQEAPHFFVGRMLHQTLAYWTEFPGESIGTIWAGILEEEIDAYKERYSKTVGTNPSQAEIDDKMSEAYLPYQMASNYAEYYKQPLPEGYSLIQMEQTCLVAIPNTNMYLEGTLDGLVVDETTGFIYVLERKTYDQRPRIDDLQSNEQFVGYCWLIHQLFPTHILGGVLYDGLWKRPSPPNKRKIEDLFLRELLLKSEYELEEYEKQLIAVAKEIENGPAIYPNRTWQGCWDDKAYSRLCTAESKGYDFEAIKEEYVKQDLIDWLGDDSYD